MLCGITWLDVKRELMYIKSVENVKGNYICDLYNENNIKIIKTFKKLIEKVKFITYTIDMEIRRCKQC